jgi:GDPmannose 4,6-dehydratase
VIDPQLYRPAEVDLLVADPTKARRRLGWQAQMSFQDLVHDMVDEDLARLSEAPRLAARPEVLLAA